MTMKIAIIADQHGTLPTIPECDLMVISGDITGANPHGPRDHSDEYWWEWLHTRFADWITGAPHTIAVAGNHDTCLEFRNPNPLPNFDYLLNSGCEFGGLKFWGAPWVRQWDRLAFNIPDDGMELEFRVVPNDTDVVVCHMPPMGAGDKPPPYDTHRVGSYWIAEMVRRVKPKLLTCGHIHDGRGIYDLFGAKVVNAARGFTVIDI